MISWYVHGLCVELGLSYFGGLGHDVPQECVLVMHLITLEELLQE